MHISPFDPELSFAIRLCAALRGMTPSAFVRSAIRSTVDTVADAEPLIRIALDHRP
jgi:hypothetical protein